MGDGGRKKREPGDGCDGPTEEPSEDGAKQGVEKDGRTKPLEAWARSELFLSHSGTGQDWQDRKAEDGAAT